MSILSSLGHGLRLARAAYVFAREGAFLGVDPALLPPVARLPLALANLIAKRNVDGLTGLSRAIDRLGPSYVKLGQFLSTRPDIVGAKVALELERLQDRVAPMSRETAIGIIEASFGAKIESLFESFGEPVAAASIAQVHRAEARTGDGVRPVAVKVLRAGVERRFARDLGDMFFAARLAERFARSSAGCARSRSSRRSRARCAWRWTFGSKRRRRRNSPKIPVTIRIFARRRSTGTAPPAK